MSVQFLRPWMLLLLLLLPWIVMQARGVRVLSTFRRRLAVLIRLLLVTLLALTLAEPQWIRTGQSLAVLFVMDRSESIPTQQRQFAESYIERQVREKEDADRAGLVIFGKDAVIEAAPGPHLSTSGLQSVINSQATDIAGAIRLAMAAFPSDAARRIVVLSDGNQTVGDAELEAKRAASKGVEVSIMPLRYVYEQEVIMREVVVPPRVRADEPFDVKILVDSLYEGPATLRLYGDGQVLSEQEVILEKGLNAFVISQETQAGGFHNYEAVIEAAGDARPDNNRGTGFVYIRGQPRLLVLDGTTGTDSQYLAAALRSEGMQVDIRGTTNAPGTLAEYEAYDGIALVNYSAAYLSHEQMLMIESAVRDFGKGLVMIGGQDSFGSGGYLNTPIERTLPVSMDIKQRKIMPSGALAMIMHTCEIPQGNYWAQQIAIAALDVLSPQDYVGFLRYSNVNQESWLFPLEPAGDKSNQLQLLQSLSWQDLGDMPSFDRTLVMAYESLIAAPCNIKHIVIISDGDPQPPNPTLANGIRQAGITISTVTIAPHNLSNLAAMKRLAEWGGGNAYNVQNNEELPRIFAKEATTVRRGLIIEEPFTPAISQLHEAVMGFPQGFPELKGYVIATHKPSATLALVSHQEDPILSLWNYGTGKAVAWTSDASPRWQQNWIGWDGYTPFWSQLIRWMMPAGENENVQVTTSIEGDHAKVVVDAVNEDGKFMNGLNFTGKVVSPDIESRDFGLRQTAPGRYEGTFPITDPGNHMISLGFKGEGVEGYTTSGVAVPFSPEKASTEHSDFLLARIAEAGGGKVLGIEDNAFSHDLPLARETIPLWPFLLAMSLVLFFLDIAQRRIAVEFRQIQELLARVAAKLPIPKFLQPAPVGPATDEMGGLMKAKARALQPGAPKPSLTAEEPAAESEAPPVSREELLARLDRLAEEDVEDVGQKQALKERKKVEPIDTGEAKAEPLDTSGATGYTSSLLEAKRRAQERFKPKDK